MPYMSRAPVLGRLRPEAGKLEANLVYRVTSRPARTSDKSISNSEIREQVVAQLVECLPCLCKDMGSISNIVTGMVLRAQNPSTLEVDVERLKN